MVVEQAVQVVMVNWKPLSVGLFLGSVITIIVLFTVYLAVRVFPNINQYVNLVNSYCRFLWKAKKEKKSESALLEEWNRSRHLMYVLMLIIVCLIMMGVIK